MVREKCHTSCQKDSQTGKYHESICLVITLSDISGSPPQSSMLTGSSVGGAWCSPETCTNSHMHTHIHTRAFSWSSSKEPNKTFTTWLSLPPTSLSICFFGLFCIFPSRSVSAPMILCAVTSLDFSPSYVRFFLSAL